MEQSCTVVDRFLCVVSTFVSCSLCMHALLIVDACFSGFDTAV